MPDPLAGQTVACHRCGHPYQVHRPACGDAASGACPCPGFRWIDPAPAPDHLGYHRDGGPS